MKKKVNKISKKSASAKDKKKAKVVKLEVVESKREDIVELQKYEKPTIEALPASIDKAMDYLTAVGLSENEAKALKGVIPVLPLDGELVAHCHKFVELHQAGWNHNEWLSFISELEKKGYCISSEQTQYFWAHKMVGSLLETLKVNYAVKQNLIEKAA